MWVGVGLSRIIALRRGTFASLSLLTLINAGLLNGCFVLMYSAYLQTPMDVSKTSDSFLVSVFERPTPILNSALFPAEALLSVPVLVVASQALSVARWSESITMPLRIHQAVGAHRRVLLGQVMLILSASAVAVGFVVSAGQVVIVQWLAQQIIPLHPYPTACLYVPGILVVLSTGVGAWVLRSGLVRM